MSDPLLGIIFVARQASSQATAVLKITQASEKPTEDVFGINPVEFAKYSMPTAWLMNRKLDFEISVCGPSISTRHSTQPRIRDRLRFVSFPCDCLPHPVADEDEDSQQTENPRPASLTTAFNIVFVLDSDIVDEESSELYWQCISTLSRALISEEDRTNYLSYQVCQIQQNHRDSSLFTLLQDAFEGLRSSDRGVSLYVNGSILTHITVIPFGNAPSPPKGYQSLLLTSNESSDSLQTKLPVDSASNVRRLLDAAEPTKTIKDHMIELGLPVSTIQRISQHLTYWKKARIVHTLHKRTVLVLSSSSSDTVGVKPEDSILFQFASRYNIRQKNLARNIFFKLLNLFSHGKYLADVKDDLSLVLPQLHPRFNDICTFLLSRGILDYSNQYFRYFPPIGGPATSGGVTTVGGVKRLLPSAPGRGSKFQSLLPHEIRSQFSPYEFEVIFERLKYNAIGSELMVRLISSYVKKHSDLLTARIELNEKFRCTNDDFHKFTDALISGGSLDALLVKYDV